jgi:hypothetical protein
MTGDEERKNKDPMEESDDRLPVWWKRGKPTPRLDPRLFLMMIAVLVLAVVLERCWTWMRGSPTGMGVDSL